MTFNLFMIDPNETIHKLTYDPHTSLLTDEHGERLFPPRTSDAPDPFPIVPKKSYFDSDADAFAVSPENPGSKSSAPRRIKIQLGLGCNYSCSYCLQSLEVHKAAATSTRDADIFLQNLDRWLDPSNLEKIEFWGGEPLLYWNKIEKLAPKLREKFPSVKFSIITNGTLLTKEIIDQLYDWNFSMAISHDGPGQHLRGPDPFDEDPNFSNIVRYASVKFGKNFSFNAVLTPGSYDPLAVIRWFERKHFYGKCNFEGVVHDYNGGIESRFTPDQLEDLTELLVKRMFEDGLAKVQPFKAKIEDTISAIANGRPSRILGQKCGMDLEDQLAVDLLGNITTCQNVGAKGEHRIGSVMLMDKARLNTSYHWSTREECRKCPVLQLCRGSCMYQTGNNFVSSCNAEFALNMAVFIVALKILTNMDLIGIEGDMIRPQYT